jgi:lincosamide nucleotidyltransferase A/C/D/E
MDPEAVLEVVQLLEAAGVTCWLDGGWGVDALLGAQSRPHRDLDLIVRVADLGRIRSALGARGFAPRPGGSERNVVFADSAGLAVDVHAIDFDSRGYGVFRLPDGRRWPFPPSAFAGVGRVLGRELRCLSAEAQVQCHGQGYAPLEKDLADMQRLQERFGVVLPLVLCRQV